MGVARLLRIGKSAVVGEGDAYRKGRAVKARILDHLNPSSGTHLRRTPEPVAGRFAGGDMEAYPATAGVGIRYRGHCQGLSPDQRAGHTVCVGVQTGSPGARASLCRSGFHDGHGHGTGAQRLPGIQCRGGRAADSRGVDGCSAPGNPRAGASILQWFCGPRLPCRMHR
jgi:hypothetical protein